jgi:hypothetical protein
MVSKARISVSPKNQALIEKIKEDHPALEHIKTEHIALMALDKGLEELALKLKKDRNGVCEILAHKNEEFTEE